jgi:hypothetical protein
MNRDKNSTPTHLTANILGFYVQLSVPTANINHLHCDYFDYTVGFRDLEMKHSLLPK